MVEVFKTNVEQTEQSEMLINQISNHLPNGQINFDLEDCDKILRVEADSISNQTIIELLNQNGFHAEVLI
jgi:tRNA G26 N,N-dimethylase Trm1